MPYWVKRIRLKTGEVVTEKELGPDANRSTDAAPVVGDVIAVTCRGRTFQARVIWGNWPGHDAWAGHEDKRPAVDVVPLRVEEI